MTQTVLILGATGRFGRNAVAAFDQAGWAVRTFQRGTQSLDSATNGAQVIVNAWNPPYTHWAQQVPKLTQQVIAAASNSDSTVIIPGNVYVFGAQPADAWSGSTPHTAANPLGRIRIDMEEAYRASSVKTILLRAGDFIDTRPSGNWFDRVMIKRLPQGQFTYPGRPDSVHSWAYLPDLAEAAVGLAEIRDSLPRYCDLSYPGYSVTGHELAQALTRVTGNDVTLRQMHWWSLYLARPFWPMAKHLIEMRYLWDLPHRLDGSDFDALLPEFQQTALDDALRIAVGSVLANDPA